MKVKVIENHWLPKKLNVVAITLYPRIYLAIDYKTAIATDVINHEFIHVRQVREQGWLRFYMTYLFDYAKNCFKYNKLQAYMRIPAEIEAYAEQSNTPYPNTVQIIDGVMKEI